MVTMCSVSDKNNQNQSDTEESWTQVQELARVQELDKSLRVGSSSRARSSSRDRSSSRVKFQF